MTATFQIFRLVSVYRWFETFDPLLSQRSHFILIYVCHMYCVYCVDFWIKHLDCTELVNKRFPLYYIYCAEEMNLSTESNVQVTIDTPGQPECFI